MVFSKEVLLNQIIKMNDYETISHIAQNYFALPLIITLILFALVSIIIWATTRSFWFSFIVSFILLIILITVIILGFPSYFLTLKN